MKAVILAAGRGTRMGALTAETPKPMVLVQGKPILETIVTGLAEAAGIRDFFIIIGYQGSVIRNHFGDGSKWGVRITYGEQVVQDGTGKAPELAREWVGSDPFLLTYGDILVDASDYKRLSEAFEPDGIIAIKGGEDLSKGGAVILNDAGEMIDLIEKGNFTTTPKNAYYNAGIYCFTPRIFEFTARLEKSPRGEYELTDALKALVKEGGRLRGVEITRRWVDVRDPGVLASLNASQS